MKEIRLVLFLVFALVLNVVLYKLLYALHLPFYMDSVGSILVALCCGLYWGLGVAVATVLLFALFISTGSLAFLPVALVVVLCAYFAYKKGFFKSVYGALASGAVTGIVAALISAVITIFWFDGFTGAGVDWLVSFLSNLRVPLNGAVIIANVLTDAFDKAVQFVAVFYVLKFMPWLMKDQASLR